MSYFIEHCTLHIGICRRIKLSRRIKLFVRLKQPKQQALSLRRRVGNIVWQVCAVNRGQEKLRSGYQSERKRTIA